LLGYKVKFPYMDGDVSPKVWTVCVIFNAFLDGWAMKNVSFDWGFDLGLV